MTIHASQQQIMQAIDNLSQAEWTMLARGAQKRLWGTRFFEPGDLINATVELLLAGTRRWPLHIQFGPFLQRTMQSVAGSDRRLLSSQAQHVQWEALEGAEAGARLSVPSVEDVLSQSQRERIMAESAIAARARLDGDPMAQRAIDAMLSDMTPSEACVALGIPPRLFEPARKRAYRQIKLVAGARLAPKPRNLEGNIDD